MLAEIRCGQITTQDGGVNPARGTKEGALVVSQIQADYGEWALRGQIFVAANQAATTTSAALTTTQLGLCINNPAGSGKNLVMLHVGYSNGAAPTALAHIGIQGGYAAAGVVTHTTPLTVQNAFLNGAAGVGKADAACTTVGTPVILLALGTMPITGATAQVVTPPFTGLYYDLKGSIIVPPGGWVALYTSTQVSMIASMMWAEVTA